jgi:hypothetical protein
MLCASHAVSDGCFDNRKSKIEGGWGIQEDPELAEVEKAKRA